MLILLTYILTYLRLLSLVEKHKPPTSTFHPILFWANVFSSFELLFILFISASDSRRYMFFGLPLFRFASGFQVRACIVVQFSDLRNACPIHFQRLVLISYWADSRFVFPHSRMLLMVSGQRILGVLRIQLFINSCTISMMVV